MPFIKALTGLRFLAAASIVLWHSQAEYLFGANAFAPFVLSGAVSLFFVLSGYVLTINAAKYRATPTFLVARLARIWPAHAAAVLFWAAIFYPYSLDLVATRDGARKLAVNLLLLQSWFPDVATYWSYNAPSWSVSCELFFYAVFPLCLMALRRQPILALAGFIAAGAVFLFAAGALAPDLDFLWVGYINPVANLPVFVLGIATGLLHMRLAPTKTGLLAGTALQLGAVALAAWGNHAMAAIDVRPFSTTVTVFINNSGACWCYALLIFALGRYQGIVSLALSRPALVYLGEISYAIYLFHQPILRWHSLHYMEFHIPIWIQYAGVWAATIAVAALVHHAVERPAQRWVRLAWKQAGRAFALPDAR